MHKRIALLCAVIAITAIFVTPLYARAQDVIKLYEDVDITESMTVNDVVAIRGNVTVAGRVESNIVVVNGMVILKPKARVGGEIVVVGGDVVKDPSAFIHGKVSQIYLPHFIPSLIDFLKGKWVALWATISILVLAGFLGLAILLLALIPTHIATATLALERSFATMFLWGALWAILVVPIALVCAISIIGIVLIPLEILLVALALITGYIVAARFIGIRIFATLKKEPLPFIDVVTGILALFLIGFIPIIGPLVKIIFLTAGFGATITTRFGTAR